MPTYIYALVGPSGKRYVGLSKDPRARAHSHFRRARENRGRHPLYDAIRSHGREMFTLEVLAGPMTLEEAREAEREWIARFRSTLRSEGYNVSPGGEADSGFGGKYFWANLRKDPAALRAYLARLSAGVLRACAEGRVPRPEHLIAFNRSKPAKQRWREQHRMTRISARLERSVAQMGRPGPAVLPETLRAAWDRKSPAEKKRHAWECRNRARAQWAGRTAAEVVEVSTKIAATLRDVYAPGTDARKRLAIDAARARASMDRVKQGEAASKGLKGWWADLKADPVRYRAHIDARSSSLKKTLAGK